MGWIFEGVPLVFAGVLTAAVSLVGRRRRLDHRDRRLR
jgi:hypothetical protein